MLHVPCYTDHERREKMIWKPISAVISAVEEQNYEAQIASIFSSPVGYVLVGCVVFIIAASIAVLIIAKKRK